MIKGFKEFIAQGNALELAVAVIIGGAFKPIVDSITKVILDIVGQIVGSPNFDSVLQFKIDSGSDTYIQPGTILTALINFILVAAAVYFCIVVPMNKMRALQKKQEEDKPAEPTDVELLGEIRDLLAARNH
ncbi:large conductance mechanosensitive channel protein MscL [Actinomyces timonensis]|uniref:Large-conductance mechanosensitive channel n=1 Tax=Actinomyces timonensis TaxID=1288391 RepID=A0AAU8N1L4_9ACTO